MSFIAEAEAEQAEQAERDAENKQRRAANPDEVLIKFRKKSGLKSDDLNAIKVDECFELDPSKYFLRNNGGVRISLMPVGAPDPSTEATRGGYYLDSRRNILDFDVDGYLTKVESLGIDLFAYMWMYKGDGVFYRELVEAVPGGGGHRRVRIRAGNWMVPMDAAAETELRHRMCYFYYEPV